jgi:hypothetical protein
VGDDPRAQNAARQAAQFEPVGSIALLGMRLRKEIDAGSLIDSTGTKVRDELPELSILEGLVVGVALPNVRVRKVVLDVAQDRFEMARDVPRRPERMTRLKFVRGQMPNQEPFEIIDQVFQHVRAPLAA